LDYKKSADIPWTDLVKVGCFMAICLTNYKLMKLVFKGKKVGNPKRNRWEQATSDTMVSEDGLNATNTTEFYGHCFAEEEFGLSVADCREDNFSGIIIYYFEVTQMSPNTSG
jgi:hypothetical protein